MAAATMGTPTLTVICRACGSRAAIPLRITPDPEHSCRHFLHAIVSIDDDALRGFASAHHGPFVTA